MPLRSPSAAASRPARPAPPALLAAFVLAGIATTLLGPLLPWLGARWGLGSARLGGFFLAQFLASMLGVVVSGWLLPRGRFRLALAGGLALLAAGLATVVIPYPADLVSVAVYGVGLGLIIPAANLRVASDAGPNSAAALNTLNLAWGLGAIASPVLVAAALALGRPSLVLAAFAALPAALALAFALRATVAAPPSPAQARENPPVKAARAPRSWLLLALLLFLYVGCENTVGGWISSWARLFPIASVAWLWPVGFFWAGLLGGRALAPWPLRRIPAARWARWMLVVAFAGQWLLLFPTRFAIASLPVLCCGAALAGLGLAVVFPTLLSFLSPPRADSSPPRAADPLLFVPAGLGGAVLPWLAGEAARRLAAPRAAFVLAAAAIAVLWLLLPAAAAATRPAARPAPSPPGARERRNAAAG